jgi:hypothetical protein
VNELKSPAADIIRLPSITEEQNYTIETLNDKFKGVQHPSELDVATKNVGMPASLLNFYFATQVDLTSIHLGKVVHIPVMISTREGGRKSIYFLDQNEEVLAGIYVTCEGGIALHFVKRMTGSTIPAQKGDLYSTRITNRGGELIFEGREKLLRFDPQTGAGQFVPSFGTESANTLLAATGNPRPCIFFSLFQQ